MFKPLKYAIVLTTLVLSSRNSFSQTKLANGLTYKVQNQSGKPVNYYVQDASDKSGATSGPARYIVKFKSDPDSKAKLKKAPPRASADHANFLSDLKRIESVHQKKNPKSFVETKIHHDFTRAFNGKAFTANRHVVDELKKLSYVSYIIEDKQIKVSDIKSSQIIEADKVWSQYHATGKGVVIGIIDTGIDYNHPDIGDGLGIGHKVIGGYDFVNDDNDPMDDHGHGTHCAGIAAANGPNLKGVAPDANLMAFKVLTQDGWGYTSWIVAGIERCLDPDQNPNTDDKVDVANMSLGGQSNGPDPMSEAVDNAVQAGVVFAVAAGNSGFLGYGSIGSPGIAENAITVGATDSLDAVAYFSSLGPAPGTNSLKPDIMAPGVNIYSSLPNGQYARWSGTSMATPHVTGAAALLRQLHPSWTPSQIKAAIMESAVNLNGSKLQVGAGRLDVLNAAKQSFLVEPASISLGIIDRSSPVAIYNLPLTVSNVSNVTKNFTLTPGGDFTSPGITATIDHPNVTLSAGASQVVHVSLSLQTAQLMVRTIPDMYLGLVTVSDNTSSVNVPVGFLNTDHIKLHFDSPLPDIVAMTGVDNFTFKFIFPTAQDVDLIAAPGVYDFIGIYQNHYDIHENISVPAVTDLSFSKSNTSHAIVFQPKDEQNQPVNPLGRVGDATIVSQKSGPGFMTIYFGAMDSLFVSDLSQQWKIAFHMNDVSGISSDKIYNFFATQFGATESSVLSNSPSDLVTVKYKYDHLPNSAISLSSRFNVGIANSFSFSIYGYDVPISSDFTEYYQKMDKGDMVLGTHYQLKSLNASGYNYQTPQITIYKNDSVAYHRGVFGSFLDTENLSSPSLTIPFGETMLGWTGTTNNTTNHIIANPNYLDGYFIHNRSDKVLGQISYSLSNSSGLVASGQVTNPLDGSISPWDVTNKYIELTNGAPDSYKLKIDFRDYQVSGRYGRARVNLNFNTASADLNPPYLLDYSLRVNGKLSNQIQQGDAATLNVVVTDECYQFNYACGGINSGVASYYVQYRNLNDSTWINLPIVNNALTIPGNLSEGFYSLHFYAADFSGNSLDYLLEPAFIVGTNPNPVPFIKPQLISPENNAVRVAQNPIFRWTDIADNYSFQLSSDSTFTNLIKNVDVATDSLVLDFLLTQETKYFWRVGAKYASGLTNWSDASSFTTGSGTASIVHLIAPANQSTGLPGWVTFTWSSVPGAMGYLFKLGQSDFNSFVSVVTDTTITIAVYPGKSWVWEVKPQLQTVDGEWSSSFYFTTGLPVISNRIPADNATDVDFNPYFSWDDNFIGGAYRIQVATSSDFANPIIDQTVYNKFYSQGGVQFATKYYWRVQANYPDVSVWSDVNSFTTLMPSISLNYPFNYEDEIPLNPTLTWDDEVVGVNYHLVVSPNADLSQPIVNTDINVKSYNLSDLFLESAYYWAVRADYPAGPVWSTTNVFFTQPVSLGLTSPADNSLGVTKNVTFNWQPLPVNAQYKLFLSTSSNFNDPLVTTSNASATILNLNEGTAYFWKVGVNYNGVEYYSDVYSFRTEGVTAVEERSQTKIYPNPASSIVHFEFGASTHKVKITNSLGQPVWNHEGSQNSADWYTTSVEGGVYIAQINDGEVTSTQKIVIYK